MPRIRNAGHKELSVLSLPDSYIQPFFTQRTASYIYIYIYFNISNIAILYFANKGKKLEAYEIK